MSKLPSDAQVAVLTVVAEYEERGTDLYWRPGYAWRRGWAALAREEIDREVNRGAWLTWSQNDVREVSVSACVRHGWLDDSHEAVVVNGITTANTYYVGHLPPPDPEVLRQLTLTEDGVIALGLWRERRLAAPPPPLPTLSDSDKEIVELAQRAFELGYVLCPRKPARNEARRMRREGWFETCWVANSAYGLVPSPIALVEVRPTLADSPMIEKSPSDV